MPFRSNCSTTTTTILSPPYRHSTTSSRSNNSFTALRLLPSSRSRSTTPQTSPSKPINTSTTRNQMSFLPSSPARQLSSLPIKSQRKTHVKSSKGSRPSVPSRAQSPALLQDHPSLSDTQRPINKKSRSSHRSKPRSRARSLSPPRSPVLPVRPPLEPTLLHPESAFPRRTRTVTLNDQPTLVKASAHRSSRNSRAPPSLDFFAQDRPCKAVRPKRPSKPIRRSGRTRAERRRTCTGSSDEADLVLKIDDVDDERSPTLDSAPSEPSPIVIAQRPPSAGALRPEPAKPRQHGRAKSVASILDVAPGDDWEMPPSTTRPSLGLLTWQQRQKPKTTEPPTLATPSSNLAKKLAAAETTLSPLLRSSSLVRPGRGTRSTLARTPSAGTVLGSSSLFGPDQVVTSPAVLFGGTTSLPTSPNAVMDGSFSVPPSPTPAQKVSVVATKPVTMTEDSSLTWQQAILRSSPPKNVFASLSCEKLISSNIEPKQPKKILANPVAFTTPTKSGTIGSSRSRGSLNKMAVALDDLVRSGKSKNMMITKRRNSMSSTTVPTNSQQLSNSPECEPKILNKPENILIESKREERSGSLPNSATSKKLNYKLIHRASTPLPSTFDHDSKSLLLHHDLHSMYAGPQFHNSPAPTTLPAPKFSFGS